MSDDYRLCPAGNPGCNRLCRDIVGERVNIRKNGNGCLVDNGSKRPHVCDGGIDNLISGFGIYSGYSRMNTRGAGGGSSAKIDRVLLCEPLLKFFHYGAFGAVQSTRFNYPPENIQFLLTEVSSGVVCVAW